MRGVLVFLRFVFYFLIKKLLVHPHIATGVWRLCHSGDVCNVVWWLNQVIHSLPECATVSSSTSCGVCMLIMVGLPLMIDFFFCFFFLFSLRQFKCTIVLFVCYFLISVLILWISYFILIPFIEVLFSFQFYHSITIYHMFCFSFQSSFI
jgi:hypothetical protein